MQTKQKGITATAIVMAVLIFAAALATGVYFYESRLAIQDEPEQISPPYHLKEGDAAADETAGWQTYRNEKYGFEFKYPQNISIMGEKDYETPYENLLLAVKFGENGKIYCVEYDIDVKNTKYASIDNWAADTINEIKSSTEYEGDTIGPRNVLTTADLNIGNVPAKKIISDGGFPFWNGSFAVIKDGKIYKFYYGNLTSIDSEERKPACFGQSGDENKYLKIYDQMLSTFKFIGQ